MLIRADLVFPAVDPNDATARLPIGLMLVLFGMVYLLMMVPPLDAMIAPKPMDWTAHSYLEG